MGLKQSLESLYIYGQVVVRQNDSIVFENIRKFKGG